MKKTGIPLIILIILLMVMMTSCKTTGESILPASVNSIHIAVFNNQTLQYGVEDRLTDRVVNEFEFNARLHIENRNNADIILTGIITRADFQPFSYDEDNVVKEYQLRMEVRISLHDRVNDTYIFKDEIIRGETTYDVDLSTEDQAIDEVIVDLAEDIVRRCIEGY